MSEREDKGQPETSPQRTPARHNAAPGMLMSAIAIVTALLLSIRRDPPAPTPSPLPEPLPPPVPRVALPSDALRDRATGLIMLLGAVGFTWLAWQAAGRRVLVPTQDIPAYAIVRASDLPPSPAARFRLAPVSGPVYRASAREASDLLNHYARAPLSADKPIARNLLLMAAPQGTVVVGVPATDALLLDGAVRPGDRIDLWLTPPSSKPENGKPAPPPGPVAFEGLVVLDVRPSADCPECSPPASIGSRPPAAPVLILALPAVRRQQFAALLPGASLLLMLRR